MHIKQREKYVTRKKFKRFWSYDSIVECFPGMWDILHLSLTTEERKDGVRKERGREGESRRNYKDGKFQVLI